ncbi:MAG: peptidylprolyl isomerase, partial [Deltaproteobacteria bacterium]|nr:peptidylprolyl isomerase [Deltaproteobacteria bacterium]
MLATFIVAFGFNVSARAEVVDRIVAVVNDDIITLSELDIATKVALGGLKSDDLEELLADAD